MPEVQPTSTTSYDEIPYPGNFFTATHPDRMATTATLFGTPGDVTVDELAIEAFLPADEATAAWLGAARPALRSARVTA